MKGIRIVSCETRGWSVPPEMSEFRVAIVGAGKMARLHLATLVAMPGVRLVGICNRTSDAGEGLAREFGIDRAYRDLDQMLRECRADAVFVAVSHAASYEVTSTVLDARIPCLVEKPAGYSSDEASRLASLADEMGCLNIVGVNRRYFSTINQALLAVGQHGPVRGVLVEAHEPILEYRSRRQFDSWVYDKWMVANTVHAIDLLRMIGGDVADVKSFGRRINEPGGDSFTAAIQFESGALGTFVAHSNSVRGVSLKIYGEGITAELSPLESGFVIYDTGSRVKLRPDWSDTRFKAGLYAQNSAFLQAVIDRVAVSYPASDLRDHVKTLQLIEQIQTGNGITTKSQPDHQPSLIVDERQVERAST